MPSKKKAAENCQWRNNTDGGRSRLTGPNTKKNLNMFTRRAKRHFPGDPFCAPLQMTALCSAAPAAGRQPNRTRTWIRNEHKHTMWHSSGRAEM